MKITVSDQAREHIRKKGGRAAVELVCVSSWAGSFVEVSVDTNVVRRRDTSRYRAIRQDGIELLVSRDLARQSQQLSIELSIELKQFWFFRNLKVVAESSSGLLRRQ